MDYRKFFDAYKELDNLLKDAYQTEKGVSTYLELMEEKHARGVRLVPNWQDDYKKLKHLRYVRNQIAHNDAGEEALTEEDLADVIAFKKRVFTGTDPLSKLRAAEEQFKRPDSSSKKVVSNKKTAAESSYFQDKRKENQKSKKASNSHNGILILCVLVIIIGFVAWAVWGR